MGDKKHIDRLFQERFKEFEAMPNEAVWNNIAAQLGQKKKRRLVPIWLRFGGIAAAIILLLALGYNQFIATEAPIVNENQLVQENEKAILEQLGQEDSITNTEKGKGAVEGIANTSSIEPNTVEDLPEKREIITSKQKQLILEEGVVQSNKSKDGRKSSEAFAVNNQSNSSKDQINEADSKEKRVGVNSSELSKATLQGDKLATSSITKDGASVKQDTKEYNNTIKPLLAIKDDKTLNTDKSIAENIPSEEVKINLEDAIAQKNSAEESGEVEKSADKWQINTMLAPVYYNSIGEGSPIAEQFKDNSKQGNVNLSYGLNIAYNLSNKLSLRSGVNKVNLGYETQNISYQASFEGGDLATVNYTRTAANITVRDIPINNASTVNSSNDELFVSASTARNGLGTVGTMNQQLAYIEVPLELTFKIVDSKLGVNIIGGLSSLFLIDNTITLESANLITDMGEANNINDLSFSTNIGLGFDYKVTRRLHFNLEPMFKYQLNAFSENSGNFKPYYLGVYTGFSFKF